MLRRVSSAACFVVLLAGAATCAPSAADAAVVCQNDGPAGSHENRAPGRVWPFVNATGRLSKSALTVVSSERPS